MWLTDSPMLASCLRLLGMLLSEACLPGVSIHINLESIITFLLCGVSSSLKLIIPSWILPFSGRSHYLKDALEGKVFGENFILEAREKLQ